MKKQYTSPKSNEPHFHSFIEHFVKRRFMYVCTVLLVGRSLLPPSILHSTVKCNGAYYDDIGCGTLSLSATKFDLQSKIKVQPFGLSSDMAAL